MDNYEYIVASLPSITSEASSAKDVDREGILTWIKEQCSDKDVRTIDFLLSGYDEDSLGEEFYRKALSHKNRFIREFFAYDLAVRNTKVRFLNKAFSRDEDKDIFSPTPSLPEAQAALSTDDILQRERNLDNLMWKEIERITVYDYFDIEKILGFVAKLQIVSRWLNLDPKTGEELFRKMLTEVRGTYGGVHYNDKQN